MSGTGCGLGAGLVLAAVMGLAMPAGAAELGFWNTTAGGRLATGLGQDAAGGTDLHLSGDVGLDVPLVAGFGLGLGLFGLASDLTGKPETPHESYGMLTWQGAGVEVSAGVPRPAYDTVAVSPLERWAPLRGIASDRVRQTRGRATWGAMYDGKLPVGLRVEGLDALHWAVSVHRIDPAVTSLSGSLSGSFPDSPASDTGLVEYALAVEWSSDGQVGVKAQVTREVGPWGLGASGYVSPTPGGGSLGEVWVDWHATQALTLSGIAQSPSGETALGGVAARCDLGRGLDLTGAFVVEGGGAMADVSLGWRF